MGNCDGGVGERAFHSLCPLHSPAAIQCFGRVSWEHLHGWQGIGRWVPKIPTHSLHRFAWLWWVWDSRGGSAKGLPSQPILQPLHCHESRASNAAWCINLRSPQEFLLAQSRGSPRTKTHLQAGFYDPSLATGEACQSPALSMGKLCYKLLLRFQLENSLSLDSWVACGRACPHPLLPVSCCSWAISNSFPSSYTCMKYAMK